MKTKIIKSKIKSIGSLKKITKTMEMISVAKVKKSIDSALLLRPFRLEAERVLSDISLDPLIQHELLMHNKVKGDVVIIIASNKGLCGSYNVNVYRKLIESYNEEQRKNLKIIAFGKFSEKVSKKLHLETLASYSRPILTSVDAHATTTMIVNWYREKKIGTVHILYTYFASGTTFIPTLLQLLPFSKVDKSDISNVPRYTYEPDQATVFSTIIPIMLHNIIYGAILESYASEHSARMIAMKNATDNAEELQNELKLHYNSARQAAVTQEIAEITAGAMAI